MKGQNYSHFIVSIFISILDEFFKRIIDPMSINRIGAHELDKRGLSQPYFKIEQDEKIPLEVMKSKAYQKFPSV